VTPGRGGPFTIPLSMRPGAIWRDHVPRRRAFERAHPDVTILPPDDRSSRWLALIDEDTVPGDNRSMAITRYELADLLDALDDLFPP
jgi:hypothetical protein